MAMVASGPLAGKEAERARVDEVKVARRKMRPIRILLVNTRSS